MKKLVYLVLGLALLCSCNGKDNPEKPASIVGEWVLSSYTTKAVTIGTEKVDIYLKFDASSFDLYQMLGAGRYTHYSGTYTLSGNILSGKYSDGKSWASQYSVSIENNKLTLTQSPDGKEVQTFTSTTIPDSVKNNTY
ncbi:MAG: lipocalin family protein [Bacteroidales bacterium]|nr:lipocalin family protein [Bacteroidales bacterium]